MTEIWLPTHISSYEVSNFGRIRSIDRQVWDGKAFRFQKGAIKVPSNNGKGYMIVNLYHNGKQNMCHIHRLVATAFIANPLNKKTVNHIDGNKSNNHVSNLEWATYKENQNHAFDTGLNKGCKTVPVCQLTMDMVPLKTFKSVSQAARETGICRGSIAECVKPFRPNQGHSAGGFKWEYVTNL